MDLFDNKTLCCNLTTEETVTTNKGSTGKYVMPAVLCVCTWIAIANLFVSLFFFCNKRRLRNVSASTHILSLSVTDLQVGLSSVLISMSYVFKETFVSYDICAFMFYYYLTSQFASMYHTFAICAHRCFTIFSRLRASTTDSRKVTRSCMLVQIVIIWLIAAALSSIPFVLYRRVDSELPLCSLNTLFGDGYEGMLTISGLCLFVPQVVVSVLYCLLCAKLSSRWRSVSTNAIGSSFCNRLVMLLHCRCRNRQVNIVDVEQGAEMKDKNSFGASTSSSAHMFLVSHHKRNTPITQDRQCDSNEKHNTDDKKCGTSYNSNPRRNTNVPSNGESSGTSSGGVRFPQVRNTYFLGKRLGVMNTRTGHRSDKSATTEVKRNVQRMDDYQQVMLTIGILLLVLNICMTPLNLLFVIEKKTSGKLSRETKFMILAMSLCNSAVNPFIYAFRIRPFREACMDVARKLIRRQHT